ncbi:MAG: hypothetical protein NVS4B12_24260 [Ktedonobacteraceae bacterium]
MRDSATVFLGVLSRFVYCITFAYAMPTPCSYKYKDPLETGE